MDNSPVTMLASPLEDDQQSKQSELTKDQQKTQLSKQKQPEERAEEGRKTDRNTVTVATVTGMRSAAQQKNGEGEAHMGEVEPRAVQGDKNQSIK